MLAVSNFYFIIGALGTAVLVLVTPYYNSRQKIVLLLAVTLAFLWLDKPDWFIELLGEIEARFREWELLRQSR